MRPLMLKAKSREKVFELLPLCMCTKFQVFRSTRFGDTLGCAPKFMGSRELGQAPFLDFSLRFFWGIATVHLCTKFQVSSSTRFGDTLGCTPKFMGVTWPMPRPFSEVLFAGFWDIAPMHPCTKFQDSSSTRFGDTLGCTPKFWGSRDLGHAPFLDFSLWVFEILPMCSCVPNFKFLSLLVLEIC